MLFQTSSKAKKHRITTEFISNYADFSSIGVTGFEPAASTSQMSRATNCATPRNNNMYLFSQ